MEKLCSSTMSYHEMSCYGAEQCFVQAISEKMKASQFHVEALSGELIS